jgi:transposase-like protein
VKRALHGIFYAGGLREARALAERFFAGFRREFPSACELLERHLGECLTFYRYPEAHWKYLRSTNILERAFREVRRRTQVIGRFPDEMAALELIFGVLEEKRLKWHRLNLQPEDVADIERAVKSLDEEPVWIELGKAASA